MDFSTVTEVRTSYDADETNRALTDGWTLVAAGVDPSGFPVFVLASTSTMTATSLPAADPAELAAVAPEPPDAAPAGT